MKSNPYDPNYIMKRDNCTLEAALETIALLKEKNAWNRGKKIKKSNPYDPDYVMKRDNCTLEVALETIDNFKKNKATSLENFIKKYGIDQGKKLHEEWKNKSLKKGWETAKQNGRSQTPRCKEYYLRKGYTLEQSILKVKEFQHENSPLHIPYYIKRGKSFEYAKKKIRQIHDQKIGIDSYKVYLEKTTNLTQEEIFQKIKKSKGHNTLENLGEEEFSRRIQQTRKTFEEKGIWVPYSDLSDYQKYHREALRYTNQNDLSKLKHYEKRGRAGVPGAYHLDHKFSISRGFIEGVDPELIGSIKNLEYIPWEENVSKQGKCSITKEELLLE